MADLKLKAAIQIAALTEQRKAALLELKKEVSATLDALAEGIKALDPAEVKEVFAEPALAKSLGILGLQPIGTATAVTRSQPRKSVTTKAATKTGSRAPRGQWQATVLAILGNKEMTTGEIVKEFKTEHSNPSALLAGMAKAGTIAKKGEKWHKK